MAKSARASSRKANNQRLAANVFGPVEAARAERLHAKLLELAKQPKPESSDVAMDAAEGSADADKEDKAEGDETTMDVDAKPSKARIGKKRVDKRRVKKAGIVFRKYSDRIAAKKKKATPSTSAATA
ncbi:hypothetical protein EDB80DRAFT_723146 [Ilyonectria destructans]|nr:hypothetical protein EDB80DRAFT_723146 [Ilyonectria destructans]